MKCHSCEVEASVLDGSASQADRTHWHLWGCTCDPESEADAIEFMRLMSE